MTPCCLEHAHLRHYLRTPLVQPQIGKHRLLTESHIDTSHIVPPMDPVLAQDYRYLRRMLHPPQLERGKRVRDLFFPLSSPVVSSAG
jgi:hypothetical protein